MQHVFQNFKQKDSYETTLHQLNRNETSTSDPMNKEVAAEVANDSNNNCQLPVSLRQGI